MAVVRFTVDEYHRMADAGVLAPDDRVELLEGWVRPKVVHTPRHAAAERVTAAVAAALADIGHRDGPSSP